MADMEECKRAVQKAMNLLLRQDRTRKELSDRLCRAGFSEEASGYAMEYVESFGYIDDRRYAENFVAFHKGDLSAKELRYKLTGKGIPPDILSEIFMEYEPEDEEGALRTKLEKRLRGKQLSDMDFVEKNKIIAYLKRKGYNLAAVKRVMNKWESQEH